MAFVLGCQDAKVSVTARPELSSYEQMQARIVAAQWHEAAALIEKVLIESPQDPNALESSARVAFQTNQRDLAADLLVDACVATNFEHEPRIRQAFTGLLAVGRLFDAIHLLERGVEADPKNTAMRKMLHSFLVGTERHREAAQQARVLIRQRDFDEALLQSLGDPDRRTAEADSLVEMTRRNPADLRPLIGKARFFLDRGQYPDCIEMLARIVKQHPDDHISQVMLGRALMFAGQHDQLTSWSTHLTAGVEEFADYWLTLGDWAWNEDQHDVALAAYANAARRNLDEVQIWNKFALAIGAHAPSSPDFDAVNQRSKDLAQLRQLQANFQITTNKTETAYTDIASALIGLGRLWEAEAWLAVGQSNLPSMTTSGASIMAMRQTLVQQLSLQTPWQSTVALDQWSSDKTSDQLAILSKLGEHLASIDESHADLVSRSILPMLVNEAEERGLNFRGATGEHLDQPGIQIHRSLGCGGGVIDYDLDGWPDLYLAAAGGTPVNSDSQPNALFRNLGGAFVDIATDSDCANRGFGQGVAVGDVNADGFDDLLVLNYGPNALLINNGDGTFSDASHQWLANQDRTAWSTSAAIADIDGDAIADAVITNYHSGLSPSTVYCGSEGLEGHRSCSPLSFAAEPDVFLRGEPDGAWVDATRSWKAEPEILGRGLGIVVGTFVPGRINDIYIANDMTPNHYYSKQENVEPFELSESAAISGLANDAFSRSQGSMGIATSDFNGDGVIDFYVTNFDNEYNTLHLSHGRQFWRDDTNVRGLVTDTLPMVGFGTKAVDLDLNGSDEIAVANGHVDIYDGESKYAPYAQAFQVFAQNARGTFESIESKIESAYLQSKHVGRTLFKCDINRDHLPDLIVTHQTEPVALLVNKTPTDYAFLNLRFVATQSERNAIGTRVELVSDQGTSHTTLTSGDGYFCSDQRCIRFGLGDSSALVTVIVQWPSGRQDQFELATDHEWLLIEGDEPFAQ